MNALVAVLAKSPRRTEQGSFAALVAFGYQLGEGKHNLLVSIRSTGRRTLRARERPGQVLPTAYGVTGLESVPPIAFALIALP